ncbi:MAG: hypothetical protein ACSHX9_07360 [Luteolibacter sp.]
MSEIPSSEEQELSKLSPAALDEGFLARLTASAEGTAVELSPEEMDFEANLRRMKPRNAPSALSNSLLDTLSEAPFAVDEKIVLFNGKSRNETKTGKNNIFRFNIAAAAAVALLGSIAAFMVPQNSGTTPLTVSNISSPASLEEVAVPYVPPSESQNFSTASFDTTLSETKDEGVVWSSAFQPQRIMRFTYTDEVTVENQEGQKVQVKQPRVEYVIIPEKVD